MTEPTKPEPSEGARRAAPGVYNFLQQIDWSLSGVDWKLAHLAEIIDRETHSAEMRKALEAAKMQIEYLHGKFKETGSGNQVLAQIEAALKGGAL